MSMLLAIDIGNTHTVIGVFSPDRLLAEWRISSSTRRTLDETWHLVKSFLVDSSIDPVALTHVGVASVVPDLTSTYEAIASKFLRTQAYVIDGTAEVGMQLLVHDPSTVGADRLCNAVAGFAKYGGPLIVIDLGTATTYDVIDASGNYLGGAIALGLESEAAELHRRAAKLPKIELRFPPSVIGKETVSSMQAGVMYSAVDAIEGMVRRIRSEMGKPLRVIATGGLSSVVAPYCPSIEHTEPSLVLDGIRLLCERAGHLPAR
ncbi:MAG: type III pantothenate kinase [Bacteroidota bacterium]